MAKVLRAIFSGSRNFDDATPVCIALEALKDKGHWVIVHGAAPGLDSLVGQLAEEYGFEVESHPAPWSEKGTAAGSIRNQEMVDLGAKIAFAFPLPDSRGTWDFVRRAKSAGIPVLLWAENTFKWA